METVYQLFHNELNRRYEFHIENHTAYIDYRIKGDIMHLLFAKVPYELEGMGIGRALVFAVMEEVERLGYKVVPHCGFIAVVIKRNPELHKYLAE
ncbi:MAG: N-acetyltransferase [Salinivirgaceae bacterium]|nr:MAG: N-acetyltransferase [Salinivirgaceae bacterium]